MLAGICVDEVVAVVRGRGEEAPGEEQRPGECSGGLKEFSAVGDIGSLGIGPLGRRFW